MANPKFDVNVPHLPVYAGDLSLGLRAGKYMSIDLLSCNPIILQNGTQAAPVSIPTFPTAVQDNVDTIHFPNALGHSAVEMYQTTAQTLMPLLHATKGLSIALDQVDNESVEYVPGGNKATNPLGYTAGTDPGVFFRATFEFTNSDGLDQFVLGFRKQAAYAVPTGFLAATDPIYTDFVAIGFAGAVAIPNQVRVITDLNDQGAAPTVSATNFFIADGGIHTLEVRIKGRKVSYFINGVQLGDRVAKNGLGTAITAQATATPPQYTCDVGDFLIPFIFCRQDAGLSTVFLRKLSCGQLLEDGLQPDGRGPQT